MRRIKTAKLIDDALLRRWPLPELGQHADKVTRGDVLIVGGTSEIPGAALLAAAGALRAGAGRVQLVVPRAVATSLAIAFPEARVIGARQTGDGEISGSYARSLRRELAKCRAMLVGPGMSSAQAAQSLLREAVGVGCSATAILDAGAIQLLAKARPLPASSLSGVIATPHAGEMAQLWGCDASEVHADPLALAREAARSLQVTIVLKGTETFIVDPDGTAFRNTAGNVGLATAGSGDTLAGIIAGLAARGAEPAQAAAWGVYLHARAGDALARTVGPLGYLARELPGEVPKQLARLSRPRARA